MAAGDTNVGITPRSLSYSIEARSIALESYHTSSDIERLVIAEISHASRLWRLPRF